MLLVNYLWKPGLLFPTGKEGWQGRSVVWERRSDEGGRDSLESWGEVRVAADRQIAAERVKTDWNNE